MTEAKNHEIQAHIHRPLVQLKTAHNIITEQATEIANERDCRTRVDDKRKEKIKSKVERGKGKGVMG
jgi:hypothetical protein